jgi:hypothetical protein
MKKTQASVQVKKVKGVVAPPPDMSESFRRARSSISEITADLQQLRRRATSAVKGSQRPAKSK